MLKPKYRFPEFQEDWLQTSLGEVVEENLEPIPMPKNGYTRVGIYCHAKGTFQEYVPEGKGLDVDTMYVVHKDNLIVNITFAWEHAIAITKEEDEGKIVSHRFPTYKFKEGQIPAFYKYLILDKRMEYNLMVASPGGAGRNRVLNKEQFLQIPIKHPSITEQQKISDFLSCIDSKIKNQEQIVKDYEDMKKGLIQKLFSQQIRFKKQDGSNYPDWVENTIGNLCKIQKGAPLTKADISENGTPFILYGELYTTYKEITYDIARVTNKKVDEKYYSKVGDVIIPTSGETPEEISTATCIMKDGVILAGDLNIYRSQTLDGRYFSYIMNHLKKYEVAKIAQGISIIHIQANQISKIKIPVPDLEEQQKIADFLYTYDLKISKEQQILEEYKTLKKALLQQMFP